VKIFVVSSSVIKLSVILLNVEAFKQAATSDEAKVFKSRNLNVAKINKRRMFGDDREKEYIELKSCCWPIWQKRPKIKSVSF
jgi:hypothetical protein